MNAYQIGFALVAFLGLVATIPVFMHFTAPSQTAGLPVEVRFLAGMMPPAFALLLLVSWIDPGGGA